MESKLTIDGVGNKFWKLPSGVLHREDGPAVEWANGSREYQVNGERHRIDGPAIEWANGDKQWYLNDDWYETEEEWKKAVEVYKAKKIADLF